MERESGEELSVDEEIALFESEMTKMRGREYEQTIVEEGDFKDHLSQGWEFVSVLPSNRVIIRRLRRTLNGIKRL